jgi:hypothetical protein
VTDFEHQSPAHLPIPPARARETRSDRPTAAAHPIGSVLVFLHLLEGEIERIGKRLLVHAQEQATRPDSAADLDVNWVWHTGAAAVFRFRRGLFGALPRLLRRCPSHQ